MEANLLAIVVMGLGLAIFMMILDYKIYNDELNSESDMEKNDDRKI